MKVGEGRQYPRNMTPNFLRFKKKSVGRKETSEEPREPNDYRASEKSSSKASKCSLEVFEKRVLNLSKLKNTLNVRKKEEDRGYEAKKGRGSNADSENKRAGSNERPNDYLNYVERENLVFVPQKLNSFLSRKRSSGSGNLIRPKSRQRLSNPKRNEQSLQREQEHAKQQNTELINNLMRYQHVPNYISKLKMKKEEATQQQQAPLKKLSNNFTAVRKRRFFEDPSIEMKPQEALAKYELHGQLGKGAYGVVKMAIERASKDKYAVKVYEKSKLDEPNKVRNIEREIAILGRLDHPVISKLVESIETPNELYLVLQYGGANSLYKYLLSKQEHRLSQKEAKEFFRTVLTAVDYLHSRHIVHRDIKAENILLNRHKQLKLIDFGFSLVSKPPETIDTFCGTPTYMAPEIVSKRDHVPIYTDMWSLGVLFYVMLQGNYPFRSKSEPELFDRIRKGTYELIYDDVTDRSKQLLRGLLCVNPLQRYTARQLLEPEWSQWFCQ